MNEEQIQATEVTTGHLEATETTTGHLEATEITTGVLGEATEATES